MQNLHLNKETIDDDSLTWKDEALFSFLLVLAKTVSKVLLAFAAASCPAIKSLNKPMLKVGRRGCSNSPARHQPRVGITLA